MIRARARLFPLAAITLAGCAGLFGEGAQGPIVAEPEWIALPPPPESPEPPAPPPAPVAVAPDEGFLLGRSGAEIESMLGRPDLARRERGVELMQYLDTDCVLDIRLRSSADAMDVARADHLAARSRRGEDYSTADCLARLLPESLWPLREIQPPS